MLLALAGIDETRSWRVGATGSRGGASSRCDVVALVLSVPGLGGNVDWSPDGTTFVTEGPEDSGLIDIRDAKTGASVRRPRRRRQRRRVQPRRIDARYRRRRRFVCGTRDR